MTLAVDGQSSTIFIVPKDNFGNNASVASLTAVMAEISSSATADVVSSGGQLTFSATRSGTYRLSVILGSIASTLSVPVAPAEVNPYHFILCLPWLLTMLFFKKRVLNLVRRLRGDMQVFVKTLTGKTIAVWVRPSWKISELKSAVMLRVGFPPDQRYIFAGKQLDDGHTFADYSHSDSSGARWPGPAE